MPSMISKISLYILLLILLTTSVLATQALFIDSAIECIDNKNNSFIAFSVHDVNGIMKTNDTTNCTITLRNQEKILPVTSLLYQNGVFYQNLSTAFMGTKDWQMAYHVHCIDGGEGYLTSNVYVGDCTSYYAKVFDRTIDPGIYWGWFLAIIIMTFFTIYFTTQHHALSYMFLIIDLLLMNVLFWFSAQSCNLQRLAFCTTMWTLYRMSLIITFFMIIIIFIEFVKWLIIAKDKKNKRKEFEEYGYNSRPEK